MRFAPLKWCIKLRPRCLMEVAARYSGGWENTAPNERCLTSLKPFICFFSLPLSTCVPPDIGPCTRRRWWCSSYIPYIPSFFLLVPGELRPRHSSQVMTLGYDNRRWGVVQRGVIHYPCVFQRKKGSFYIHCLPQVTAHLHCHWEIASLQDIEFKHTVKVKPHLKSCLFDLFIRSEIVLSPAWAITCSRNCTNGISAGS